MTRRARLAAVALATLSGLGALGAGRALAMKLPIPHEYGRVVLDAGSSQAGLAPVSFDHWRHRARFTCRLCHVDVGFAMTPGATQVTAASNRGGFHCGACHDGKSRFWGQVLFAACGAGAPPPGGGTCVRCHARPDPAALEKAYAAFARDLPRDRFGGVDWEKAEAAGKITPADHLEGVSIRRDPLKNQREITLQSKGTWMNDVLFSHPKHARWNGCEVCHPEIYPAASGGARASMLAITGGESCGACHDKVAFPLVDCEKCHLKPVQ